MKSQTKLLDFFYDSMKNIFYFFWYVFVICSIIDNNYIMRLFLLFVLLIVILISTLIHKIDYKKINSKLKVVAEVNAFVLTIVISIIAFLNSNIKNDKDFFSPENDAIITGILLMPFISAIIFFQYYLSGTTKNYLCLKIAFFLLYGTVFCILGFFVCAICINLHLSLSLSSLMLYFFACAKKLIIFVSL